MVRKGRLRSLNHYFDACSHPLYLIDLEGHFLYFNRAFRDWISIPIDGWIGKSVRKPSDAIHTDSLAIALTPPASLGEAMPVEVSVQRPINAGPQSAGTIGLETKRIRFTRFGADECALIIASVGSDSNLPLPSIPSLDLQILRSVIARSHGNDRREDFGLSLLGEQPQNLLARRQLSLASKSNEHVVLIGSPGNQGEHVARVLHGLSTAANGPFAPIDAPLMDVELLEHSTIPVLEYLNESRERHATLFLRHVDELPLEPAERLQSWLHQFEGRLRCLSTSRASLHSRLMDSHREELESKRSSLPTKLAVQLSTIEVYLPVLAEQPSEIPVLAAALLSRRQSLGAKAEGFSRAALDQLTIYPWPGDFAELDEAIRHATRSCPRGAIQPEHLPLQIRSWRPQTKVKSHEPIELDQVLVSVEAELIRRALKQCDDNRTHAARQLGISRQRLIRRIAELHIEAAPDPASSEIVP